jgi:beta-xylosidase
VVEAVVLWNEPNNLSHWNFRLDPDWKRFAEMATMASAAIRDENPDLPIVLGGVSACDCDFLRLMSSYGVMDYVDAVGVHGFPLDWNHWPIGEWPDRLDEAAAVSGKPVWVLEVGASYYRHYHLGLLKSDGTPKLSADLFPTDGSVGICQWFHFEDHRLDDAVAWMRDHGVRHVRTGLSWADSYRPNASAWFDRMMSALEPFDVSLTLCFTPAHLGLEEHHTSPPRDNRQFAEFAVWAVNRYAPSFATANSSPWERRAITA